MYRGGVCVLCLQVIFINYIKRQEDEVREERYLKYNINETNDDDNLCCGAPEKPANGLSSAVHIICARTEGECFPGAFHKCN